MSLYSHFETDDTAEKNGIWLEYPANEDGTVPRIRIARAGGSNDVYLKRLEARLKPYRRAIQNETIARTQLEKIVREVYAETVILGWENVQDKAHKPIEFNKDNALKLLTDLPDLFTDIQEQSQLKALFRRDIQEAAAKN